MFISVFDIFKVGIGPSSSHTTAPMVAANTFLQLACKHILLDKKNKLHTKYKIQCVLKGSLAFTGKNHESDKAILLGLNCYIPKKLINKNIDTLSNKLMKQKQITIKSHNKNNIKIDFDFDKDIIFDKGKALKEHPNGMIFYLFCDDKKNLEQIYFSIGGGFIQTKEEFKNKISHSLLSKIKNLKYPFDSACSMMAITKKNNLSISDMKRANELSIMSNKNIDKNLDKIWLMMEICVNKGLSASGVLKGSLKLNKRAKNIYDKISHNSQDNDNLGNYLSAYAMAVNEENASSHMVVTAPTNGAAGVIPALLYYLVHHKKINKKQIRDFLLTAGAIGAIIKHRASISGAEVGCQGEIGSASAMGAAGVCAVNGGNVEQIENASEIALEHHLGMTCDPIDGLVQVPCIERNAFGALKAYQASSLALFNDGKHLVSLDECIATMKQIGLDMHDKYKETSLGGLATNTTWC